MVLISRIWLILFLDNKLLILERGWGSIFLMFWFLMTEGSLETKIEVFHRISFPIFFRFQSVKTLKLYRVSKKVWFVAPGAKMYLFCATLLYGVLCFNIFRKFIIFVWYSNGPKKVLEPFFLSISWVQKSKSVYTNFSIEI